MDPQAPPVPQMPAAFSGMAGLHSQSIPYGSIHGLPHPLDNITNGISNGHHNPPPSQMQSNNPRSETSDNIIVSNGEELISTAIVIKNIPFAVKKEYLVELMTSMHLPLPYAFNYHFDNGVFRGLAFANFSSPEETREVIENMNGLDLQGRKLRVEYKKMLPQQERERIEREKRERRGQLEEQHQPVNSLHNQASMSSLSSAQPATSPSPVSRRQQPSRMISPNTNSTGDADQRIAIDMNEPDTLAFYTELMMFKNDPSRDMLIFPSDTAPTSRRKIHTLAHQMGLVHKSQGDGIQRHLRIYKQDPGHDDNDMLPPITQTTSMLESQRRNLARAATIDFAESRLTSGSGPAHGLRGQGSGYLGVGSSPGLGNNLTQSAMNLRGAKSFADLRSYTPSPATSMNGGYSGAFSQNADRLEPGYSLAPGSNTLTPSSSGQFMRNHQDESYLMNGLSNLSIGGYDRGSQNRMNNRLGMDRESHNASAVGGAIGSQRPSNSNLNNSSHDGEPRSANSNAPERQPRGPSEWQTGFNRTRPNGHVTRGSGELESNGLVEGRADQM